MAEENSSATNLLEVIAKGVVETNNLLRSLSSQNSDVNTENFEGFTKSIKDLGLVVSQRGKGGRFTSGTDGIKSLYNSILRDQRSAIKLQQSVLETFNKDFISSLKSELSSLKSNKRYSMYDEEGNPKRGVFSRRLGYVSNLRVGQDVLLPNMLRKQRMSILRGVDFASGGVTPRRLNYLSDTNARVKDYIRSRREVAKSKGLSWKDLQAFREETRRGAIQIANRANYLGKVKGVGDAVTGRQAGIGFQAFLRGKTGGFKLLAGGLTKFLGANLLIAAGLKFAETIVDGLQRGRDSIKQMRQLTAQGAYAGKGSDADKVRDLMAASYMADSLGLSREQWGNKLMQYSNMGMTYKEALQGASIEQAMGIGDVAKAMQVLYRRTDAVSRNSGDLTKAFQGLKGLVGITGLSVDELSNAFTTVVSSMKGRFSESGITKMLGRFGGLVRSGDMDWGQVGSFYNRNQTAPFQDLMLRAKLLDDAGYAWDNPNTDYVGKAYQIRRNNPEKEFNQYATAYRQLMLNYAGTTDFSKIDDKTKGIISEYLSPKFGLGGIEKNPAFERIMSRVMAGGEIDREAIDMATAAKLEDPLYNMAFWTQAMFSPLTQIRDHLFSKSLPSINRDELYRSVSYSREQEQRMRDSQKENLVLNNNISVQQGMRVETNGIPGAKTNIIRRY